MSVFHFIGIVSLKEVSLSQVGKVRLSQAKKYHFDYLSKAWSSFSIKCFDVLKFDQLFRRSKIRPIVSTF